MNIKIVVPVLLMMMSLGTVRAAVALPESDPLNPKSVTEEEPKNENDKVCPVCGMATKSLMQRSVAATDDGGIVIVVGNQIFKYDRELKLSKSETFLIDMDALKRLMTEMKQNCPICSKMVESPTAKAQGHSVETSAQLRYHSNLLYPTARAQMSVEKFSYQR